MLYSTAIKSVTFNLADLLLLLLAGSTMCARGCFKAIQSVYQKCSLRVTSYDLSNSYCTNIGDQEKENIIWIGFTNDQIGFPKLCPQKFNCTLTEAEDRWKFR